ncbi:1-acyl-sn-glycerol-3-phosphate acyltransferase [Legionella quateirensis]|uniref:Glycerol-3-phosphate acyltransferase n=1 Tax=Legionella quateirensis TaxID=45072 RepID=A0A378KQ28_9GAMM|nr:1-acyl-sn-glycerol-3-phosphate acyltransferase [Legionella quateirensis]KTD47772.1 Glycerol-3-phosphate acyltransferase [Legionella quateirensis]STY16665.1 Glycerol-3-phosphate acyltransferase [Legionella quateirensis]
MAFLTRKAVAFDVLNSKKFEAELVIVAMKTGKPLNEARREAYRALRSVVSIQSPFFGFLMDRALGALYTRAWSLDVDWEALKSLQHENANKSLVFLPTHRSYADNFILAKVLQSIGMPRNYVLGGENLRFFPIGTIGRRAGGVFIRRSFKDDEIYKLVVREYMRYLVNSGANLEWYMEGGRSRTGKLRPPRYGLLSYLLSALNDDAVEDILLVPVSTTYDQLQEVGKLAAEEMGVAKEKENFRWFANYVKAQKRKNGTVYVRFGQPFSLREAIPSGNNQSLRWTIDKIAFEIFQRINQVTPVTAQALVTIALLSVHDHALTLKEVQNVIDPLLEYVAQRDLPLTALGHLRSAHGVEEVLNTLIQSGVIGRYDGGMVSVFYIEPGKHSVAAFYRNSAIHWFVNRAIVELGVMAASREGTCDAIECGLEQAFAIRDLLKFEFIFSEKSVFQEEIKIEAKLIDPDLRHLVPGKAVSSSVLEKAPFLIAHRVLPAFLEAYFIVADQLAAQPADVPVDEELFLARCIAIGKQYVLQKRLRNPECVSLELFRNALALAAKRGLLQSGSEGIMDRRRQFAEETTTAVAAVAAIGELDYRLHHHEEELH